MKLIKLKEIWPKRHMKDLLQQGTFDASGLPKVAVDGHEDMVKGLMPTGPENRSR